MHGEGREELYKEGGRHCSGEVAGEGRTGLGLRRAPRELSKGEEGEPSSRAGEEGESREEVEDMGDPAGREEGIETEEGGGGRSAGGGGSRGEGARACAVPAGGGAIRGHSNPKAPPHAGVVGEGLEQDLKGRQARGGEVGGRAREVAQETELSAPPQKGCCPRARKSQVAASSRRPCRRGP